MTLRRFRLPLIVTLIVVADMIRDIPNEWAKLAFVGLTVLAVWIIERAAYKRWYRDAEADYARRPLRTSTGQPPKKATR